MDKLKKDLEDEKEKSDKREKIILEMYNNWFKQNLFFQQDMILRFQDEAQKLGIPQDQSGVSLADWCLPKSRLLKEKCLGGLHTSTHRATHATPQ